MTAPPAESGDRGRAAPVEIGSEVIRPGRRRTFEIPMARLPTDTWLSLPVVVVNGRSPGPSVFLCGAVHGDELNGVDIIRRVTREVDARELRGTLIAVPIVNVFGFVNESRYLPDRRDLNRSFPGSKRGPLAARMAHLFMTEVVERCQYGIDLHTGSWHRTNLPQVRADLHDPENRRIAEAFGAPVMLHSQVRDGSLRQCATTRGVHVLLYEAGEANRFDDWAIEPGVEGTLRVLAALGMWESPSAPPPPAPLAAAQSHWIRARRGGILKLRVRLGSEVERHQPLGVISNAFGSSASEIRARGAGTVIGHTRKPLVNQGDAVVHVADSPGAPEDVLLRTAGVRDDVLRGPRT